MAAQGALRKVGGYIAIQPAAALPNIFGLLGPAALLAAINKTFALTFVASDLTFGTPSAVTGRTKNSQVAITATATNNYQGSQTLVYDRYDISTVLAAKDTSVLPSSTATTISARLPGINTQYGLNLVAGDIVDGTVAANATGLTLTIASGSYLYSPATTVRIGTAS
jgi:hypothetical protein